MIEGQLLGADHRLGHLLRDASAIAMPVEGPTKRVRVAIVGAGPAGLCAAWELDRAGEGDYLVFDLEAQSGGTSASSTRGAAPHPWGAHYVPVPLAGNADLIDLFSEMDVLEDSDPPRARERYRVRAPEQRLFIDGAWQLGLFPAAVSRAADFDELRRFEQTVQRWVSYRDAAGRRAFAIPLMTSSADPLVRALDRISASQWLADNGYRSRALRWYLENACRDDYGARLSSTSAWALLFYFAARRAEPGKPSQPFITWPEGNGAIVRHLTRKVGGRLQLRRLVHRVERSGKDLIVSCFVPDTGRTERYLAEHVILAVPQFVGRRLLGGTPPNAAPSYSAWMVANLHLSGRPESIGIDLAWDSSIYQSPSLGYVEASHQLLRDRGPTVWTYYLPLDTVEPNVARRQLLDDSLAQWQERVLQDLRVAHPDLDDYVEAIDIWRWGHAMIRPTPGTVWGSALEQARTPRDNVHYAHTDLSGLALFEEAQYWGIRAARRVLSA